MRKITKIASFVVAIAMMVTSFATFFVKNDLHVHAADPADEYCDHSVIGKWINGNDANHTYYYSCCDKNVINKEPHDYENSVCKDCGRTCGHSSVIGSCTEDGKCEYCGVIVEGTAGNKHSKDPSWTSDANGHTKTYPCCGAVVAENAKHSWYNYKCVECGYECKHENMNKNGECDCGYGCKHEGGEATCQAAAVCTKCNNSYGDVDTTNHACDIEWVSTRTKHYSVYSCNGEKATLSEKHYGGEGTCMTVAACEVCGAAYGEINTEKHAGEAVFVITDTTHAQVYDCCGEVVIAEEAHKGGNATCTAKAKCEVCEAEYGEMLAHDYSAATCLKKATCSVCGDVTGELADHDFGTDNICKVCSFERDTCGKAFDFVANFADPYKYGFSFLVGHRVHGILDSTTTWYDGSDETVKNLASGGALLGYRAKTDSGYFADVTKMGNDIVWYPGQQDMNAVICFTAPVDGLYAYEFELYSYWGCTHSSVNYSVVVNGEVHNNNSVTYPKDTTKDQSLTNFKGTVTLKAGETIYFCHNSDGSSSSDNSEINKLVVTMVHNGGEATCDKKAVCDHCGNEYGDLKAHDYTEATCTAKAKCKVCGAETGELKPHNYNKEGSCADCGAKDPNYVPPVSPDTSDKTISVALMIAAMAFLGYAIVPSKKRHTAE